MSKNKKHQAPEVIEDQDIEELDDEEITGEDVEETMEAEAKPETVELTPEQKQEKIKGLVLKLHDAKANKDVGAQKKLRRQLRKLGFYMSKEKDKALEIYLEAQTA